MNKRGISPLVATLLLISFAVALGIVIMNFGSAQVDLEAQCPINIGLRLSEVEGNPQVCYDAAKKDITFTLENGVNAKVEGMIVNIITDKRAESFELNDAKIGKAGVHLGHLQFQLNDGEVFRQIKITPKIILHDQEQICVEKALVVEEIGSC